MFDCKCILFKYLKLRIFPFFLDGFPFRGSFYPSSWIPSVHPFPSHLRWCHHPFHPGESQRGPDLFRFCFSPICSTRNKLKSVMIQYGLEITKVRLAVGWVCFTPYSQLLNKKCGKVGSEFFKNATSVPYEGVWSKDGMMAKKPCKWEVYVYYVLFFFTCFHGDGIDLGGKAPQKVVNDWT